MPIKMIIVIITITLILVYHIKQIIIPTGAIKDYMKKKLWYIESVSKIIIGI